jgi:predicted acetyltransferase
MVRFRRQPAAQGGVRGRTRRRHVGEQGVEMIQVALWAVAALVIMAVLVVAVMAFVGSRTACLNNTTITNSTNPLGGCGG